MVEPCNSPELFISGFSFPLPVLLLFAVELSPIWHRKTKQVGAESRAAFPVSSGGTTAPWRQPRDALPQLHGCEFYSSSLWFPPHRVTSCWETQLQDPSMRYQLILLALGLAFGRNILAETKVPFSCTNPDCLSLLPVWWVSLSQCLAQVH